jgi:hypothetical protein
MTAPLTDDGTVADMHLSPSPPLPSPRSHSLGLPADVGFHDIFGFDPDLLAMVRTHSPMDCSYNLKNKILTFSTLFPPLSFPSCFAGASAGARCAAAVPHHRQI